MPSRSVRLYTTAQFEEVRTACRLGRRAIRPAACRTREAHCVSGRSEADTARRPPPCCRDGPPSRGRGLTSHDA